jgi:hypothetical protein
MRVGFAREAPDMAFHITEVAPGSSVSASVGRARLPSGRGDEPAKTIYVDATSRQRDASEFDWSAFQCIHCDEPPTLAPVIQCGACGALICGGTLRQRGRDRYHYSCAVCGAKSTSKFSGEIEAFDASPGRAGAPQLADGKQGLLEAARRLLDRGRD